MNAQVSAQRVVRRTSSERMLVTCMRLASFSVTVALSGAAFVACSASSSTAASVPEILGGAATSEHPAVGLVHLAVARSFCTGTLIAPDVVLTAGHCIEGDEKVDAFYTGSGQTVSDATTDPATLGMIRYAVVDQVRYPTFEYFYTCPNPALDVALLRLAKPLTDIGAVAFGGTPRTGAACTTVGFGSHETDGGEQFLEKRVATVTISGAVRETSLDVAAVDGISSHGDSGGPLFCDGMLVATTSCQPDWPYDVVSYGNVSAGLPWLRAMVERWDPKTTVDGGI